ncbi:MAG: hypothetical protein AAF771_04095 [Pseudomonadota bacterium]
MIRTFIAFATVAALAACAPAVPNSAEQGPGFSRDLETERARRDAELQGTSPAATDLPPVDLPGETETASVDPGAISDEQDFEAVSGRETIESDAERIARQREEYTVIQPSALPQRPDTSGPNIVEFALATSNQVGEALYRRSAVNAEARFNRACSGFASQDQAQMAFLEAGGPERDRRGMDPDGDGFACFWDPTPFRAARVGARTGR